MNNFKISKVFRILTVILILVSCGSGNNPVVDTGTINSDSYEYIYSIPPQLDDGWETDSLADAGMDESYFIDLMNRLRVIRNHEIHSILVVKNERLVFEEYFPGDKFKLALYTGERGFNRNDDHTLCSATKSFTSALIGIAIDKGLIQSVQQRVFDFFPECSDLLTDASEKSDLTLEHMLTMTSGLDYDDVTYSYYDTRNDMNRMYASPEPIRFLLSKDITTTPGNVYRYNNNNTIILGEIINKATGERLDDFSDNHLFSKIGIENFEWQLLPAGVVLASGELRLRPRDMAKFGLLFLNDGVWNDEQIISKEWIELSIKRHINILYGFEDDGYGYQWWMKDIKSKGETFSTYSASGWGGQRIIQIPELDMVVVSTGGNYYKTPVLTIYDIIGDYIIPSIR
ncbi:MAG: serine hydrolase [bacterium]|nr:serine hydrolase [bacterium]